MPAEDVLMCVESLTGAPLSSCQSQGSFAAVIFQAVIVGPLAASVRSLVVFPSDRTPTHSTQYLTSVSKTHDRSTVVSECVFSREQGLLSSKCMCT